MSFYVDPWLYNCTGGAPEDTPEQAADQDVILKAMKPGAQLRPHQEGHPRRRPRQRELRHLQPTRRRHQPGLRRDPAPADDHQRHLPEPAGRGTPRPRHLGPGAVGQEVGLLELGDRPHLQGDRVRRTRRLVPRRVRHGHLPDQRQPHPVHRPLKVLQADGSVDPDGNITPAGEAVGVMKECQATPAPGTTTCGYYQYLQGTSMASPHAAGVAALAVSALGHYFSPGNFGVNPDAVTRKMTSTATNHACPPGGCRTTPTRAVTPRTPPPAWAPPEPTASTVPASSTPSAWSADRTSTAYAQQVDAHPEVSGVPRPCRARLGRVKSRREDRRRRCLSPAAGGSPGQARCRHGSAVPSRRAPRPRRRRIQYIGHPTSLAARDAPDGPNG